MDDMKKYLIVEDMQNDFIDGALGSARNDAQLPDRRKLNLKG